MIIAAALLVVCAVAFVVLCVKTLHAPECVGCRQGMDAEALDHTCGAS